MFVSGMVSMATALRDLSSFLVGDPLLGRGGVTSRLQMYREGNVNYDENGYLA